MTDQPAPGVCVCGLDIPAHSPSDWACSEPCQSAWLHHQANPQYPHPRDIRAAAEERRRNPPPFPGRPEPGGAGRALPPIAEGTEVNTDSGLYVRVGASWRPAGMWTPARGRDDLVREVAYQRWCPRCRGRRESRIEITGAVQETPGGPNRWDGQQQTCTTCGHVWQGRPLVGVIETRGEPWPALRLRLTDGYRSATITFSESDIAHVTGPRLIERLSRAWLRLERQLGGGLADTDTPTASESIRASRIRRRQWDVPAGRVSR